MPALYAVQCYSHKIWECRHLVHPYDVESMRLCSGLASSARVHMFSIQILCRVSPSEPWCCGHVGGSIGINIGKGVGVRVGRCIGRGIGEGVEMTMMIQQ